jgi:hypothetical protein
MARLQEEASAMDADSHGLTVLPFFSGGCGSGCGGNGGVGVSPPMIVPDIPAHPHTSLSLADQKPGRLPNACWSCLCRRQRGH